jgi:hypothetical protein
MNTETQTPLPDFDFINNQPGLPPKKKRPTVLLGFSVAAVFVLVFIAVFVSIASKVGKQSNGSSVAAQQQAATKLAQEYFTDITENRAGDAYPLFTASQQKNFSKEQLVEFSSTTLNTSFDLSKCTQKSAPQITTTGAVVIYNCPTRNGQYKADFQLGLISEGSGFKINSYDIKAQPV